MVNRIIVVILLLMTSKFLFCNEVCKELTVNIHSSKNFLKQNEKYFNSNSFKNKPLNEKCDCIISIFNNYYGKNYNFGIIASRKAYGDEWLKKSDNAWILTFRQQFKGIPFNYYNSVIIINKKAYFDKGIYFEVLGEKTFCNGSPLVDKNHALKIILEKRKKNHIEEMKTDLKLVYDGCEYSTGKTDKVKFCVFWKDFYGEEEGGIEDLISCSSGTIRSEQPY